MRSILLVLLSAGLAGAQPLIGVAGISHESDSFNPAKTGLSDFGWPKIPSGDEVLRMSEKASTTVSGYIEGARRFGLKLYPTVIVSATPKGPVTDEAFNTLMAEMLRQLKAAPKLDGVLLALHGAMVVESYPHGDAELVRRVREALGPQIPIMVNHDFHANITPEIVKLSNSLITYKENPHIDAKERGMQSAKIMAETVAGKVKPVQAVVKPPMMYNIVYQYTKRPPLLPIVEESRRLEQDPRVLAVSVSGGYQFADVPQMGPSVVVVTNNDPALAQKEAQRLSDMLWATRDKLVLHLPDAAEAVRMAKAADKFPVALMDMGDNIGGGSAGDSTFLLDELLKQKAEGWVVAIADPQAVQEAQRRGVGQAFDFMVGGKTDQFHGKPVRVRGIVKSLHLGEYIETEVRHGGGRYHELGLAAVIRVEGSTRDLENLLLLTTKRSSPDSLNQLISVGIYPQRQKILTVKGVIAPRAAYEPIAARIIEVDTPGLTAVNPSRFTYTRVRRPLFGLEQVITSRRADADFALTTDPESAAWKGVPGVFAVNGPRNEPHPEARTEIRSRWTGRNLYFLFISPYQTLYLKPDPHPEKETWGLWDYDVCEVFLGWDLEHIRRYWEFEVSPQQEWIDLDVDRDRKGKEVDWQWNSGFEAKTRIDRDRKIWYCEIRIPAPRTLEPGQEARINLYRIEGGPKNRKYIAWQPTGSPSFHVPEAFGKLRLE